jgi:hypothetical protein
VQDAADRVARLSNPHDPLRSAAIDLTMRVFSAVKFVAARQDRLVQQEDPAKLREMVTSAEGGDLSRPSSRQQPTTPGSRG